MIGKVSTRGNGPQFGSYLLHNQKNEQTRVFQIRGTASPDNAYDSLVEMGAYEQLTRSHKPFAQVVMNPADDHQMDDTKWQECIDIVGAKIGFSKQPMVAVIHTFKGKDHMHIAFGRYDHETETMLPVDHIGLKVKEAVVEIEQRQGHEHLLSWKEKKAVEKEALERQTLEKEAVEKQKRSRKISREFKFNSSDIAEAAQPEPVKAPEPELTPYDKMMKRIREDREKEQGYSY